MIKKRTEIFRVSVGKILGLTVLFFCLTPWASWGTNSLDSQPFAFIFSSLYLLTRANRLHTPKIYFLLLVWTILMVCIAIMMAPANSESIARAIVSYLTIPLVLLYFRDFVAEYGFPIQSIFVINYLWIIFGILEAIDPSLSEWTSQLRTTVGRGVTSLSPEPTYFAVYLIFSSWLILISYDYRPTKKATLLIALNIISIIFLAKSSMGILFLLVFLLVWYICRFGFTFGLFIFSFASILVAALLYLSADLISSLFVGTRIGVLFGYLNELGILGVVGADVSVSIRLQHAIIPLHAFIDTSFSPNGLSGFSEVARRLSQDYGSLFWYVSSSEKIMSWTGAILFETGLLGLVFIGMLLGSCWNGSKIRAVELCCLMILLFAAIPLAFSVVPILLATFRIRDREVRKTIQF